eukprot:gene30984-41246_t
MSRRTCWGCPKASDRAAQATPGAMSRPIVQGGKAGCPVRIRTSINGVRVRSLTFRRRGIGAARSRARPGGCQPSAACRCARGGVAWQPSTERANGVREAEKNK